jgi:hypothetical protein
LPLSQLTLGTISPGSDRELTTASGTVRIHFATQVEIFQSTGYNLNPQYAISNGPMGTQIDVQAGWIEIWQDGLTCIPSVDSTMVDVQQPPVYSSSFDATHTALHNDTPANIIGAHLFVVNAGAAPRIAYQVIWSPARFSIVTVRIN